MRRLFGCLALLLTCGAGPAHSSKRLQIAVTIDDLPVHAPYPPGVTPLEVNRRMIRALKAAHVPATAFVNAVNVKDTATIEALRDWRSAGFVLGNHTWSHPHLSELTIPQFEDELTKDQPVLREIGGRSDWHWFRYPFLDEGKNPAQRIAGRAVLAKHGYRVAAVTTSFSDWAWTPAWARCHSKHDAAAVAELERLYLNAVKESIVDARDNAKTLYGRDIPYVLLMHVSAMSADMMPRVLAIYRQAGFRFVSLPEAESERAYSAYTNLSLPPPEPDWKAAQQKGVTLRSAADPSQTLNRICP